ncbi:hypothetical protein CYL18_14390 [Pradoshia eiseniae]|uniref:Uncharacterized protein n=1 Tax=Pradoshia eiseniae TaxID=2064768 RepID=A0A2S7MX54_9BACI|nr:hypothetical protein CYL18_14390 [Pradoshia eiseniae]
MQKIGVFFEAYGLKRIEKGFLEMLLLRVEALCKIMKRNVKEGERVFQRMIDEGHYDHYQEDLRFINMGKSGFKRVCQFLFYWLYCSHFNS